MKNDEKEVPPILHSSFIIHPSAFPQSRRISISGVDVTGGRYREFGAGGGLFWGWGDLFYGTMAGPWWYHGTARATRGCQVPFSVLRMLMRATSNRMHEANVQRAVKHARRKLGISVLPHELRHGYATHCLERGINPRAIQQVMGHKSLETTMGYFHAESLSVCSPLESLLI